MCLSVESLFGAKKGDFADKAGAYRLPYRGKARKSMTKAGMSGAALPQWGIPKVRSSERQEAL
jgi:hypothetical protein